MATRIQIINETGTGHGTKLIDEKTGIEIPLVEKVSIPEFGAGDIIRVNVTLGLAGLDMVTEAQFQAVHPVTGRSVGIRRIEFEDGTVLESV